MRLGEEIFKALGGEDPQRISYTVTDGGEGYFRNVKRILAFSDACVALKGKRGGVRVEGTSLTLGHYCAGDLVVRGCILQVQHTD